ncbi:GNAT family N-acetyltransferase [Hymenobacter sp. 5317J-9]|uniref:GNAT family N-acetyltransferase n=1 Tax=Hymenobacter sp. 5317J-9 TaxID=2932250 RepID=UPI001FD63B2E|nr:GNAT family N-acetyltransferase [Hymenobacter sp. 5317J-9]UOQ99423.1 GNAT family N-acetyltransferase [Hymenobacter sp. 5317J-9]
MVTNLPARRLEPADLSWATAFLESACSEHPVLNYCCTGPDAHGQRLWLLEQVLRFGLRYGRVYTNAEGNALAVWIGPEHPAATLRRFLRTALLPAALWRLEWAGFQRLRHFLVATTWLRRHSLTANQHHYLLALAVRPADRGQGLGRRLLRVTLAAMHAARMPCYLDTQQPALLAFFRRLGFRMLGECTTGQAPDAPINWGLVREGHA